MTDTKFLSSKIKPVQEKSTVAEVKMMQDILCSLSTQSKNHIDKKNNQELENCNINRQIIPLVLIAEEKK